MSTATRQTFSSSFPSVSQRLRSQQLFNQQISQLFALAPVGIIASLVNSPILVFILWNVVSSETLLRWLACVVVVNVIWCVFVYRYRKANPTDEQASRWRHGFLSGNMASGFVWGSAAVVLYPHDSIPHEVVLILLLGGMIAGSTAIYSALPAAFYAYSFPTAIPVLFQLLQRHDELHLGMGMMSVLFMIMMGIVTQRSHHMLMSSLTLQFENAQLLEQVSTARDHLESIVEARTVELQTSEARYRLLAENVRDVIWVMALDGSHFTYMSPSVTSFRGYTQEEAMALSLNETLTPESAQKARVALMKELTLQQYEGHDYIESRILELEHRCKNGSTVWAEVRANLLRDKDGVVIGLVGISRDVTERKKMEEENRQLESQLLRSQKIEAVGTLAGGIAHDFNNFLTSVLGNIALAKQSKLSEESRTEFLTKAQQVIMRAKELTHQLLTFAKGGEPIKQLVSLDIVIKECASFSLSGSAVACEYIFPPGLWPTEVDSGQISQVIHNLVMNAIEAMPNGGSMTIQAENILLPSPTLKRALPLSPGPYLKVSLHDEGCGIPEDQIPKIFDPYHTTKAEGHGLGLASAYSIMKKHGGLITVDSKLGVGTEFTLIFPAAPDAEVLSASTAEPIKQGSGKVLVMDDDEHIRLVAKELLSSCGYEAQLAKDGLEALFLYKQAMKSACPFSVVILDLTVPGSIGGQETLRRLRQIDSRVKAIVSSGYSNDPVMANYEIHGFQGVVLKPYSIEELSKIMYHVVMSPLSD